MTLRDTSDLKLGNWIQTSAPPWVIKCPWCGANMHPGEFHEHPGPLPPQTLPDKTT